MNKKTWYLILMSLYVANLIIVIILSINNWHAASSSAICGWICAMLAESKLFGTND